MNRLRRASWVLGALLSSHAARAQPAPQPAEVDAPVTHEARGRVIDALGRPVRGATITLEGASDAGVRTDRAGRFAIRAPIGATLVVSDDLRGSALATVTGDELDDIVLFAHAEQIDLRGEPPAPALGAARLDREELQRIPGAGGDVVRALSAMPGVVNQQLPLGLSGVVIRGASPQDSRTLVDEFEIPLLFHALGFRAIVPVESIQSMTFVPGGFDVAYGRSSSGIVLLATRPGSDERTTQAEVSMIDGGLIAQGPLGAKTRYLVALRRSFIDFIFPLFIPASADLSLTTVPQFWDEQVRIDHELNSKWDLSISSVGTDDVFELFSSKDEDATAKRFFSNTRFVRLTAAAKYHAGEWTGSLALSGLASQLRAEVGQFQRLDVKTGSVTPRASITRTMATGLGLHEVVWSAGAEAQVGYSDIDIALPLERREGEPYPAYDPKDTRDNFQGSVWFPNFAAWTSLAANFTPRIRITNGLRVDVFGRPEEVALQPRSELQLELHRTLTARFGAGAYRRPPEHQTEFLFADARSERARQYTMGLAYAPFLGWRVQGSLYYTDRSALLTRADDGGLANTGRGTSKGAELFAILHGRSWLGWIGYAYSRSTRVDAPGAAERLFDYDQPHSLNLAWSWRRGGWTLGARFSLYSGLPYTPVLGAELDSDRNLYIPIPGEINSERVPTHHQLDLRADYAWRWGPMKMLAFLDVQNVYMDRTIITYFHSYDFTQRTAFETLPLIPSLGVRGVL